MPGTGMLGDRGDLRDTCFGSGRAREPVGSRACFEVASAALGAPWLPEGVDPPRTRRAEDAEQSKLTGERRGERLPGDRGS